jgi:hypothetical protein
LFALHLPVTPADLPTLDAAIGTREHAEVVWADSHYLSAANARFLQTRGVRLIHDPAADSTAALLLRFFGDGQPWEATLAAGLSRPLDEAPEPWRGWLLTLLAVLDDPYHIRHALAPLVEERFAACDPALRAAGEERWQRIRSYADSHVHALDLSGRRLLTLGLPRGERSEYRLLLDSLLRAKQAALALTFFDEHARLILRVCTDQVPPEEWHRLGEHLTAARIGAYLYDRRTMFLDVDESSRVTAIERVTTELQAFFGRSRR